MGIVWGFTIAGYPRPRSVRLALRDRERGSTPYGLAEEEVSMGAALVMGAQLAAGLDAVGDGVMDWHDPLRPFALAWRNVSLDGLIRFFDNNFFYRIPVFHGEPEPGDPVVPPRAARFARLAWPASYRATMPGPLTFLRLSKNESGLADADLASAITKLLAMEAEAAVKAGASFIELQEPFLADVDASPDDARLLGDLLGEVKRRTGNAKLIVSVYYNFPDPKVYEEMLNLKADYVALDVGDAWKRALDTIKSKGVGAWTPAFGVVNARDIYDDDVEVLASRVAEIARQLGLEEVVATATSGFELIPFRYSLRKTALLGVLVQRLAEKLGYTVRTPLRHV